MFQLIFCPLVFVLLKINLSEVLFLLEKITNLKNKIVFLLLFSLLLFLLLPKFMNFECRVVQWVSVGWGRLCKKHHQRNLYSRCMYNKIENSFHVRWKVFWFHNEPSNLYTLKLISIWGKTVNIFAEFLQVKRFNSIHLPPLKYIIWDFWCCGYHGET